MFRALQASFVTIVYFLLSSIVGSLVILFPARLVQIFLGGHRPYWLRVYTSYCIGPWFEMCAFLIENVLNVTVKLYGDAPVQNQSTIAICNHPSELDWLFYWCVVARTGMSRFLKIALKRVMLRIPGVGWATGVLEFLFLNRSLDHDERRIKRFFQNRFKSNLLWSFLLFPEGTDYNKRTKASSDSFCKKNNNDVFEKVLAPRHNGLRLALDCIDNRLPYLDNFTVAYTDSEGKEFKMEDAKGRFSALFGGVLPHTVHFLLQRIPISDLPISGNTANDPKLFEKWVIDIYRKKDKDLANFAKVGSFAPSKEIAYPVSFWRGFFSTLWFSFMMIAFFFIIWHVWWFRYVVLFQCSVFILGDFTGLELDN